MKCDNCGKKALYTLQSDDGNRFSLCLDCYEKHQRIHFQQIADLERQINHAAAEMETAVGLHGILPRYPERKIPQPKVINLNNIHINNSQIGILNTGNIEKVDSNVTLIRESGNAELAQGLKELSEAVINSVEVNDEIKNEVMELLSVISTEVNATPENRKGATMKAVIMQISSMLAGVEALHKIWCQVQDLLGSFLN